MEAAAATPALSEARETVIALTRQAGKVQQECGLDILPDEFARGVLKWGLMEVCLFHMKHHSPFRAASLGQCKSKVNDGQCEARVKHAWGL